MAKVKKWKHTPGTYIIRAREFVVSGLLLLCAPAFSPLIRFAPQLLPRPALCDAALPARERARHDECVVTLRARALYTPAARHAVSIEVKCLLYGAARS